MQEVIRAWGATLMSGLFLHIGQKLILSGPYMASSLRHLHSCKSGKMLAEVTPVSPYLSFTLFSFWHLFAHPEGTVSLLCQIVLFVV